MDSNGSWGTLSSGSTNDSSNGFSVMVPTDIVPGSQIFLNLRIQSEQGYDKTEVFVITAGTVSEDDPMGPDNYGYYIYDSGDENYELAPE